MKHETEEYTEIHIEDDAKPRRHIAFRILMWLLLAIGILALYMLIWSLNEYGQVPFAQVMFHLMVPLEGAGNDIVTDCVLGFVKVAVAPLALWAVLLVKLPWKRNAILRRVTRGVVIVFDVAVIVVAWNVLGLTEYLKDQMNPTTIYEDYYVDTGSTEITFPSEKKNLIYIYLESMEVSFTSEELGGALEVNHIPELSELSLVYEDFSGTYMSMDDAVQLVESGGMSPIFKLNGACTTTGATWTVGAMVAQTAGIPLSIPVNVNSYGRYATFLPGATTLGDILEEEGYTQMIMMGSKASFGGRDDYFTQHGNYFLYDYTYAVNIGKIDSEYYVNWGYEDEKLFAYAKEELEELSSEEEPFNLTLLTVDTHFPSGYRCELCENTFGVDMEDSIACSSRQVAEFVSWIMEQDFYEDTVIILAGDHPNMGNVMKDAIGDEDYLRTTNFIVINGQPAATGAYTGSEEGTNLYGTFRTYTTMDLFPTTLAAMGCTFEGDRLGLGTNLYSGRETLVEELGLEVLDEELAKTSRFYNSKLLQE